MFYDHDFTELRCFLVKLTFLNGLFYHDLFKYDKCSIVLNIFFTLLFHLKSKSRFWWKSRCMVFMLDVEFGDHLQGFDVTLQTQWFGCWLTWFMASLPPLPRDGGRADLNAASASMSYIRLLQRRIFMRIWAFGANYSACSAYRLKLNIPFFRKRFKAKFPQILMGVG